MTAHANILRQTAVRTLAVDAQTARVVAALTARGVEALLLKGPVVARRLYADDEARFYADTDLLVAPRRLDAARQTLQELGYEQRFSDRSASLIGHHGSHWHAPGSVLQVDLHQRGCVLRRAGGRGAARARAVAQMGRATLSTAMARTELLCDRSAEGGDDGALPRSPWPRGRVPARRPATSCAVREALALSASAPAART